MRRSPPQLEHAAERAHGLGAFASAAELAELARRLTPADMEEEATPAHRPGRGQCLGGR